MMRVLWTEKKNDKEVLGTVNYKRKMINTISTRQGRFMGNIRRKKTFERLVATGTIEGKRSRGRGQIKLTDGL